jgi:hypothetical protein
MTTDPRPFREITSAPRDTDVEVLHHSSGSPETLTRVTIARWDSVLHAWIRVGGDPDRRPLRRVIAWRPVCLMSGSITLGEVAEHTAVLAVAGSRCDQAGRYRQDTLIARHGADFGIPDLLGVLSADCPKRGSVTIYDRCGDHCPELPAFQILAGRWLGGLPPEEWRVEIRASCCHGDATFTMSALA